MPLRLIARYIMNHPEMIEKLANSYPFRRAAQLGASLYFRSKGVGAGTAQQMLEWLAKNGIEPKKGIALFEKVQKEFGSGKGGASGGKGGASGGLEDKLQRLKEFMERQQKQLK